MTFPLGRRAALAAPLVALLPSAVRAQQDAFPARQVQIVVPFPPGSATDLMARLLTEPIQRALGQAVIVENRSGATGAIGATAVARAAPDGHTILLGTSSVNSVLPAMRPDVGYDTLRDFAPVLLVASFPNMLVVHPDVPYWGSAPAVTDLLAGRVSMRFDNMATVWPHVQRGALRALGVTGLQRSALAPQVPAIAEVLPGYEATSWVGFMAPARTPRSSVAKLAEAARSVLALPAVVQRMTELGADPGGGGPDELARFLRSDVEKWLRVVREAGVKPE